MKLEETLKALSGAGFDRAEIYAKSGRSRLVERTSAGELVVFTDEAGWSVRAGDDRCSFFAAATGAPRPDFPWPAADGLPLELAEPPSRRAGSARPAAEPFVEPVDLDSPLLSEREGRELLRTLPRLVADEHDGARLLSARLSDGASESRLLSSTGVAARWRHRLASLEVQAAGPSGRAVGLRLTAREARGLSPRSVARRLGDLLLIAEQGEPPARDRANLLLAPPAAARLLAGLAPLWVGPRAIRAAERFADSRGRIATEALTIVDDGRLPGGAFETGVDGEGLPTARVVLVRDGRWRRPLVDWRQARTVERLLDDRSEGGGRPCVVGCARRESWRELPEPGPTHLFIVPQPSVSVASMLSGVARGYYLIDAPEAGRFALDDDRFELPVVGYALADGRPERPISGAVVRGSIGALLHGVRAIGRDLAFAPPDFRTGSPTLLVRGLEIGPR